MPSIPELVRSSSLVFSGTVVAVGTSTVSALPARANLVAVRVTRGLRVDSALGDVGGRTVTVQTRSVHELRPGQSAVFFTHSWIHGKEIAVREIGHLEIQFENEVAAAVEGLPDMHLKDRLETAQLVALAEVTEVREVLQQSRERRAPHWAIAILRVDSVLKGNAESVQLFFPTSQSHYWIRAPHFQTKQRGVFLLRASEQNAARWLDPQIFGTGAMTALDPADFQAESRLADILTFLSGK